MESVPLEKFNGHNFHAWKVNIQLHLMSRNLWAIVKGTEKAPTDARQLLEWEKREERTNSILGLSLLDSQLHLIDLSKSSTQMWEQLSKIFGEKDENEKFNLKLQLLKLKMHAGISLTSHINELKSLIRQLGDTGIEVEEDDSKAILLNSLSSNYDNAIFTLSQMPSKTLDEMIASLIVEEKRMQLGDTEVNGKAEIALFSKGRMNKNKASIECF
jgi:hypothetical protein